MERIKSTNNEHVTYGYHTTNRVSLSEKRTTNDHEPVNQDVYRMDSGQTEHLTDINARVQKKPPRYMHFSGDQLSKSADCLAEMPRGRKIKKVPAKAQDTETETETEHDKGGDDIPVEGGEVAVDTCNAGEVEGFEEVVPSAEMTTKKKTKKSCYLKDEEEEALVLEWIEANPLLWNSKDREYKNKERKDRLWAEQDETLNYDAPTEVEFDSQMAKRRTQMVNLRLYQFM